jgi:RNA polymerase sigma factor (sigma-70 family)
MATSMTDEEMIRHYLPHNSSQCFETLYNRYVNKVYRRCLQMTKDSDKAEDFTQDIFIKVFGKLEGFQQRSSFSTWLYSISYNYCADQLRLAKRFSTTQLEESHESTTYEDSLETQLQEETYQVMQQVIASLSPQERTILRLKYEDGLSIDDIAQLYDLKISAVKMRLKRSRAKVQQLCTQKFTD